MQHFPIFIATTRQRIVVSGAGETALAKLRLLLKTEARVDVFGTQPVSALRRLAGDGRITLTERAIRLGDITGATLFYAANDDATEDARVAGIARAEGALVNSVDNLGASDFITPAIVDRDPVTIAIGTEGTAPVLARKIKAELEASLPAGLGILARVGKAFRAAAEALPMGRARRQFWADYFETTGPDALAAGGEAALEPALDTLLARHMGRETGPGRVAFVGAGPGDPDLLTLKARKLLDQADVVIHDRLVAAPILELARREAVLIDAGKEGFGPSRTQEDINRLMTDHALSGAHVVRLKGGDPAIFGRLDEEIEACDAAGIGWSVVPGITAASAAVAAIGQSLTRRGRNSDVRFLTGHDTRGFAEQDWSALARPGTVAAIYMGKRSARFVQGRLMMHGARPDTPVTVVENASRADQRIIETSLAGLETAIAEAALAGPALTILGLAPRDADAADITLNAIIEREIAQ